MIARLQVEFGSAECDERRVTPARNERFVVLGMSVCERRARQERRERRDLAGRLGNPLTNCSISRSRRGRLFLLGAPPLRLPRKSRHLPRGFLSLARIQTRRPASFPDGDALRRHRSARFFRPPAAHNGASFPSPARSRSFCELAHSFGFASVPSALPEGAIWRRASESGNLAERLANGDACQLVRRPRFVSGSSESARRIRLSAARNVGVPSPRNSDIGIGTWHS